MWGLLRRSLWFNLRLWTGPLSFIAISPFFALIALLVLSDQKARRLVRSPSVGQVPVRKDDVRDVRAANGRCSSLCGSLGFLSPLNAPFHFRNPVEVAIKAQDLPQAEAAHMGNVEGVDEVEKLVLGEKVQRLQIRSFVRERETFQPQQWAQQALNFVARDVVEGL